MTERSPAWRRRALVRRWLMALFVFGQTLVAGYYLLWVLPYHGGTVVELGMLGLFAVLYAWIAVGFWTAVFGFVLRLTGGDRQSLLRRHPPEVLAQRPLQKTAVVLPVYHEPVHWTFSGLKAVFRDLERAGQLEHFEFYILSDSRDPEVWLEEQAAWRRLCRELDADGRLFYRRRTVNLNYKSGNVADFLRRWGRRCRYMVVLDADSLLSGKTLVRMVQLMEREPRVGILQTNPAIINGRTLFARLQQFANRLYSPLFATGLAAIQMGDAAFWGHNAILRTDAFMKHCGLRKLRGRGLFGGPILSHDFVEAAYMGRAGFEVWLEPGLSQSFEESPPTLADELSRDARWARGNLQHLAIMLFEPGLRFAHRMAFMNGIMSYLASPLWLAFLVLTTIEAVQMTLLPIDYFPEGHQGLIPLWPEWRPEWALGLAVSTLMLLFLPKFLAVADQLIRGSARGFGGAVRMLASVLLEIVISVLLAPVRMLTHSRHVIQALLNVTVRWAGQNRTGEATWRQALVTQLPGMVIGAGWSAFAFTLDPMFFFWSLPVAIPLVLAAPTHVLLSRTGPGTALRKRRLLVIPEEKEGLPLLDDAARFRSETGGGTSLGAVAEAVLNPVLNRLHCQLARPRGHHGRCRAPAELTERFITAGPDALSRQELCRLLQDRDCLARLHTQAWRAGPESWWGQRIQALGDGSR